MWRSKKFIIPAVLVTVLLLSSIGGIALAQDEGGDNQPGANLDALWDKVSTLYEQKTGSTLDQEALKEAFADARTAMRDEALDNYLNNLVNEGTITQAEADQYKAWLEARPDMEPFRQQLREWQETRPDVPSELTEWREACPADIPLPGGMGRFGGHGGFPGMGRITAPAE